jgi:hypothetical protein
MGKVRKKFDQYFGHEDKTEMIIFAWKNKQFAFMRRHLSSRHYFLWGPEKLVGS